jgi:hypothetical protein
MKAELEEGGGRILLGDNRRRSGHAAVGQVPCVAVWTSNGLLCVYVYSSLYIYTHTYIHTGHLG